MRRKTLFSKVATAVATWIGRPIAFALAVLAVVVWAAAGPFLGFSDVWQLTINTGTTIVTFLIVFLIQNSQNRDSEAIQIKLDELIRAVRAADDSLLDLEELHERDLHELRLHYERLAERARAAAAARGGLTKDIAAPE
ncbi:MAG: low affinity iron permease family protein [Alphaproteobacteria bacterium]